MKQVCALILSFCLLAFSVTACAANNIQVADVDGNKVELSLQDVAPGTLVVAAYSGDRMVDATATDLGPGLSKLTLTFCKALTGIDRLTAFLLQRGALRPLQPPTELSLPDDEPSPHSKVLVAYFSYTGNTEALAQKVAAASGGDLFEIVPAEDYPADTSDYYNDATRAYQEYQNPAARPAIASDCAVTDMAGYDVIFLGYPIWYGQPPRILATFLERYDLAGKTIVPFCTSGSSGFSKANLPTSGATWLAGKRFSSSASQSEVDTWVKGLNILPKEEDAVVSKLNVTFNGHTYTMSLAENSSVDAFVQYIKDSGGAVTVHAEDYGSFEKVGPLGTTIVRNDESIDTTPGDVILYQGSNICLYYSTNSWSFTRLGRLEGDLSHLRDHLGSGNVDIVYAIPG